MKDIKLNVAGTDLALEDYDFVLIDGAERVAQNIQIRLRTFVGEWYLDRNFGLPYFETILVKNPNGGLIRSILKAVILETLDVTELTQFTTEIDDLTRELFITFTCETTFGTISGEV